MLELTIAGTIELGKHAPSLRSNRGRSWFVSAFLGNKLTDGFPPTEAPMSAMGQKRKCPRLNGTSLLPSRADIVGLPRHVRKVPIVLQKSFWGDDRNFLGPLMRFV
jgi:hypothetical protein